MAKLCCVTFLLLLVLSGKALAQGPIQARVVDARTLAPLPYASVGSAGTGVDVIANEEGVFRIPAVSDADTLDITYMGYQRLRVAASTVRTWHEVRLVPSITELSAVQVVGRNDVLYDLVVNCGANLRKAGRYGGKVYYGLETRTSDLPMEGVECFYNGRFNGANIEALDLKQGRIGLLPDHGRYMVNLNTSRAFMLLHPAERTGAFPASPLQYRSRKALRRDFNITLLSVTHGQEELYWLQCTPNDSGGTFFRGELWVDPATATVHGLQLECDSCAKHPFLPMGTGDELRNVALHYREAFSILEGRPVINTVAMEYTYTYHTGTGSARLAERDPGFRNDWHFQSKGILNLFGPGESFILPLFRYDSGRTDYHKVLSMPYDSAFWADAHGLVRTERQQRDEALYAKDGLLLGSRELDPTARNQGRFFESNYAFWSPATRVRMKNVLDSAAYSLPLAKQEGATATASQVHLVVQLYLNIDPDTQGYRTFSRAVFDGFRSYCHLPDNRRSDVLLNIFFDLCEMERRRMQAALDLTGLSLERIRAIHANAERAMGRTTDSFLKETHYGTDMQVMARWNERVRSALGVDNFAILGLSTEQK